MKKTVTPKMQTCHDIGACLLHPDDCACTRDCLQAQRLAPGVIDGPYYPALTRAERWIRALLAVSMASAGVSVLAQLARLVGWL